VDYGWLKTNKSPPYWPENSKSPELSDEEDLLPDKRIVTGWALCTSKPVIDNHQPWARKLDG